MTRPIRPPRTRTPCSEQTHTEPVATNPRLLHATSAARAESLGSLRFPGGSGGMRRRQRLPRGCARGDRGNTHPRRPTSQAGWRPVRYGRAGGGLLHLLSTIRASGSDPRPRERVPVPGASPGASRGGHRRHPRSRPYNSLDGAKCLHTRRKPRMTAGFAGLPRCRASRPIRDSNPCRRRERAVS